MVIVGYIRQLLLHVFWPNKKKKACLSLFYAFAPFATREVITKGIVFQSHFGRTRVIACFELLLLYAKILLVVQNFNMTLKKAVCDALISGGIASKGKI